MLAALNGKHEKLERALAPTTQALYQGSLLKLQFTTRVLTWVHLGLCSYLRGENQSPRIVALARVFSDRISSLLISYGTPCTDLRAPHVMGSALMMQLERASTVKQQESILRSVIQTASTQTVNEWKDHFKAAQVLSAPATLGLTSLADPFAELALSMSAERIHSSVAFEGMQQQLRESFLAKKQVQALNALVKKEKGQEEGIVAEPDAGVADPAKAVKRRAYQLTLSAEKGPILAEIWELYYKTEEATFTQRFKGPDLSLL